MEAIAMSYAILMSEQKLSDNLRVRISPTMKAELDTAFDGQKISQQDGVIALMEFFLTLDDVGRAMALGQIRPNAKDIADLLLRRTHQRAAGQAAEDAAFDEITEEMRGKGKGKRKGA